MIGLLKKKWYWGLFLLIGLIIFLFTKHTTTAVNKESVPYTVKNESLKEVLSLSGKVDAEERTILRFQSAGKLSWVGVKVGDVVKKYQGVASLDKRDLQKRQEKYLNSYMTSRWNFDQAQSDNKNENTSNLSDVQKEKIRRAAEKAQFDLNNSVLDVELQNLAVEYSYLSTPIEGVVVRVDSPYAGVNILPTQAEFEIVNPKTLYFSAAVDQTEVVKIQENMSGEILLDAYPDKTFQGSIKDIGFTPKLGETGTVYEVKVSMGENADLNQYRIGMSGDITFTLRERTVLAIPREYIKTEGDKKYVTKDQAGSKVKVYVTQGEVQDGLIEVTSGLQEGDIIYD